MSENEQAFAIRRAAADDAPALGRLGALLLRTHHDFDRQRFLAPGDAPEDGYAWFLRGQLRRKGVVIFVAELKETGAVAGYVYAGIEPMSWKELRDEAGFIHDVAVEPSARRLGIAAALIEAASAWLKEQGAPRVMLWTAEQNADAQRLFAVLAGGTGAEELIEGLSIGVGAAIEPGLGVLDFDAVVAAMPEDYDGDYMIEVDVPSVDDRFFMFVKVLSSCAEPARAALTGTSSTPRGSSCPRAPRRRACR